MSGTNSYFFLLFLHLSATALYRAGATLGHDHLRTAFPAEIHLSQLVGHESVLLFVLLLPREFGCPLCEECVHAFGSILSRLQQGVQIFFQTDPLIER